MISKIRDIILSIAGDRLNSIDIDKLENDFANLINNVPTFTLQRVNDGVFENVHLDQILFIVKDDDEPIIRTLQHKYKNALVTSDLKTLLDFHGFELLGRDCFVQISKVKSFDSVNHTIYFNNDIPLRISSKKMPIVKKVCSVDIADKNAPLYAPIVRRTGFT